jgi:hypothetical protein
MSTSTLSARCTPHGRISDRPVVSFGRNVARDADLLDDG